MIEILEIKEKNGWECTKPIIRYDGEELPIFSRNIGAFSEVCLLQKDAIKL